MAVSRLFDDPVEGQPAQQLPVVAPLGSMVTKQSGVVSRGGWSQLPAVQQSPTTTVPAIHRKTMRTPLAYTYWLRIRTR